MSKSKINAEELFKDCATMHPDLVRLDDENLSLKEISKISNKIKKTNKELKDKYKNLDSKK